MKAPKKSKTDLVYSGAKATLSLIPILGGTALEIFSALISSPFDKRVEEWMELVSKELRKIEEKQNGVVQSLPQNEEFISLLKIPEYIEPPFRRKLHHLLNDEFVIQI
jgi:hypothetical protein